MERWMWFAVMSMLCAGGTAVLGKQGMDGVSAELALTVRTVFVCLFVLLFAWMVVPLSALRTLRVSNVAWLGLSAASTAASWIFYYKALKQGDVATVALLDKGSVVIAILLAWLWLGEPLTARKLGGAGLVVAGLLVMARKPG